MANTAQKIKKKPERRCAGCSEHKPKSELLRVVRTPEGEVKVDFSGKLSGRGVYVCASVECLRRARKAKRFESGLEVEIPDSVYARLEREISGT